jgi:transcription initiation factor TFIIH subunit 4
MDGQVEEGRCIIIETNYKMYAYTTSVLQEQVLRLFTEVDYKLPHMLIGVITRKSVRRALTIGITATQIIDYLYMHAHPQVSRVVTCVILPTNSTQTYSDDN